MTASPRLSVVIPLLNEAPSLRPLADEIRAVASSLPTPLEILFIDDGSTDDSWAEVNKLAAEDPRIRGIRFRTNFGKAAALACGFASARADYVFSMDADLQDDPAELPRLLNELEDGLDLVSGWKKIRHDPWTKRIPSKVFNSLVSRVTGVRLHDHNCGFKGYRRQVVEEIHLYGELHRYTPVLAAARGFRVGEVEVHHRPRRFGKSKYGWQRIIRGFLDLYTVQGLTRYGPRPQHFLGGVGLVLGAAGMVGLVYFMSATAFGWSVQLPLLVVLLVAGLLGSQFLLAGMLAELILARSAAIQTPYVISESTVPPITAEGQP